MVKQLKYQRPQSLKSLSIVLPAYNEAENLPSVLADAVASALSVTKNYEVIVVNDGSRDNTAEVVKNFSAKNPRVRLINNVVNLGYGPTVRKGLDSAVKDWVFFTDADGQFDLREIKRLVKFSDTHDFIIGNRINRKDPFRRRMNANIFNIAARIFFGIKVKDVDCAFKLMRRSRLHELELLSESAMINTEILHRAKVANMNIKQVSVTHKPRLAGESTGGNPDVIKRAIKEFYTLRWVLLKSERARIKLNTRIVFFLSLTVGVAATIWAYQNHVILAYGDAEAHLNIAKRVTTSLTPGIAQLGGIWLPLPHLLMAPFVAINPLWTSGLGGSIVSVAAFVFLCTTLYRLAYELTRNFTASYIAPLVVLLNPNSVYLATTPMTEILLLSMFSASVLYFVKWLRTQKILHLVLASIFTALAGLSRYDGWALVCIEAFCLGLFLILKKKGYRVIEGMLFLYSFVAFMGIFLWLIWNKVIFNNFMYFSNSVYGSKEQQLFFLKNGYLPTYHDLYKSVLYFLEDIRLVVGLPIVILALGGLAAFVYKLIRDRQYRYLIVIALALTPVFFYVLSLYVGQASLILPTFAKAGAKYTISNTRYGLQILLFIGIFAAYLGAKYKQIIPFIILLIGLQGFTFIHSDSVITYVDGTRGLSSQAVSKGPDAPKVEEFMRKNYDSGLLLMDDYRRPIGPVESGVPMQDFIGSGNKPYWSDSFDDPGKYAEWVVLQKSDTDAIWKNLKRKDLIDQEFINVYRAGNLYVYKKKSIDTTIVRQSGQHLTLDGKSYTMSGVNSYDILSQPQSVINDRITSMQLAKMNTLRIWCFNKNGGISGNELRNLDYLIHRADQENIKIICVFGNTYNDYGGPQNFVADGKVDSFFNSNAARVAYKRYIGQILTHVSSYNHRQIKDQSAIAAWELINEPRIEGQTSSTKLADWTENIAQYVSSIDQKHLISPGTEGFTDSYDGQTYNQQHGSSIEGLCSLDVITLCSGHLYPKYFAGGESAALDYSAIGTTLHTWRELADKNNKPFYVGEVGYDLSQGNLANRSAYFQNVHNSLLANNLDGGLIWNLGDQSDTTFTLTYNNQEGRQIITDWPYRLK